MSRRIFNIWYLIEKALQVSIYIYIYIYIYFQSHNPSCIDNFLTNQNAILKFCKTFDTDLSDSHKLISIVTKSWYFQRAISEKSLRIIQKFWPGTFKYHIKG